MKKTLIGISSLILLGLPALTFAQYTSKPDYFTGLIDNGIIIVRDLLIFLISLAVVWFIWNVIKYSMSKEEDGKDKAKSQMIHGIIAIAVIVSIWGIVGLLQTAFLGTTSPAGATGDYNAMIPNGQ